MVSPAPRSKLPRVLVIARDRPFRIIIGHLLGREGISCQSATNYDEAELLLTAENIDAILVDWRRVSQARGEEFVQYLLSRPRRVPYLLLCASLPDVPDHWPVLAKPFSKEQLLKALWKISGG